MNSYPFYWEISGGNGLRIFAHWWEEEATDAKKDMAVHSTRLKLRESRMQRSKTQPIAIQIDPLTGDVIAV